MSTINVDFINPQSGTTIIIGDVADDNNGATFGTMNTSGVIENQSTVFGYQAAMSATGANQNSVIIGSEAGKTANNPSSAVLIGRGAGKEATLAGSAVAIGNAAGQKVNTGGVFIGDGAGRSAEGLNMTCLGTRSGGRVTTGQRNLMLGAYAGSDGDSDVAAITTGSDNIVLQTYAGSWDSLGNVSNTVVLGGVDQTTIYSGTSTITSLSDKRDKKDGKELTIGLEFVKELKPVEFTWEERSGKRSDVKDCGFFAQDMKETEEKYGVAEFLKLVDSSNPEKLLASYGRLLPVMVKAIQELSAKVEALESK